MLINKPPDSGLGEQIRMLVNILWPDSSQQDLLVMHFIRIFLIFHCAMPFMGRTELLPHGRQWKMLQGKMGIDEYLSQ
jgi:hypothetical protein